MHERVYARQILTGHGLSVSTGLDGMWLEGMLYRMHARALPFGGWMG